MPYALIENQRLHARRWNHRQKLAVFEALGSRCILCGFNDKRALQVDHVNGKGRQERRLLNKPGAMYFRYILNSIQAGEHNKYQLLCANCNWIKRVKNNEQGGYLPATHSNRKRKSI